MSASVMPTFLPISKIKNSFLNRSKSGNKESTKALSLHFNKLVLSSGR